MATVRPPGSATRFLSALGLASRRRSDETLPTTPSSNVTFSNRPLSCTRSSLGQGSALGLGSSLMTCFLPVGSAHDDARRGADRLAGVEQFGAHPLGDGEERLRLRAVRRADDDRRAAVRGLADHDVERNLAEERHALFLGLVPGAAVREHVGAASAMRALE